MGRLRVVLAVLAGALGGFCPGVALAHDVPPLTADRVWLAWEWDPLVLILLFVSGLIYLLGILALWRRAGYGRGVRPWRAAAFFGGILALFVALVSPVEALGHELFSMHMVQHMLLIFVAAPLLILGAPHLVFLWALPARWRRGIGRWWRQASVVRAGWHGITHPAVVWVLHAAALWLWHLPGFYEAALEDNTVHALEHVSFMGTAILFWWLLAHVGVRRRLGYGAAMLYLFAAMMQGTLLGALIAFAPVPWYSAHSVYGVNDGFKLWGLSPLEDQQLAGVLMWVPAGPVFLSIFLLLVARWLRVSDQEAERRGPLRVEPGAAPGKQAKARDALWPKPRRNQPARMWIVLIALVAATQLAACGWVGSARSSVTRVPGGNVEDGREAIRRYGCTSCHIVPGVYSARSHVGPPLTNFAQRSYIGGVAPNTTENLILWIQSPQAISEETAMPPLGVSEQEARDIAAYLYTLD